MMKQPSEQNEPPRHKQRGTFDTAPRGGVENKGSPQAARYRTPVHNEKSPSRLIDEKIEELGDWRGAMLAKLRALILQADPEASEEWKWRGTPVWSHDGMICTGEAYKSAVKVTFAKGASLEDPARLFNASLEGNARRAIDFHQGDGVDEEAFKALVRAAVLLNQAGRRPAPGG